MTEDEVVANARTMAERLLPFGWDTVVVDIQWYEANAGTHAYREVSDPRLDEWGRQLPALNRFPSAADGGFSALAERIHGLGLKFGVHVMRGIPRRAVELDLPIKGTTTTAAAIADRGNTCPWNPDNFGIDATAPAAAEYYRSQAEQFAEWGVDLVKLDDVLYPPIASWDIAAYSTALRAQERPILLSVSPGRRLSSVYADFLSTYTDMWRISDDLWDDWGQVREQFQRLARWSRSPGSSGRADADMLPLGRLAVRAHVGDERDSRLTIDEQRTVLSLWTMARSPLMMGGHLPDTAEATLSLLTNRDILRIHRDGSGAREIIRDGDLVVWAAERGDVPVRAIFWLGDVDETVELFAPDLDLPGSVGRELWSGAEVDLSSGATRVRIPSHGSLVVEF